MSIGKLFFLVKGYWVKRHLNNHNGLRGVIPIKIHYPNLARHQLVQRCFEKLMPLNRSVFLDAGVIVFFGYKLLFLKKS
jgi:hypothetical protein